jgi:hypothetical protein
MADMPESVTERTMRLIKEEWTAPLIAELALVKAQRDELAAVLEHYFWTHNDNMGTAEAKAAVQDIIDNAKP